MKGKIYKRIFKEEDECDCSKCNKEGCDNRTSNMNEGCDSLQEECPYKPASSGMCASADNNSKLKNVCQEGFHWDKVHEKCVPNVKAR